MAEIWSISDTYSFEGGCWKINGVGGIGRWDWVKSTVMVWITDQVGDEIRTLEALDSSPTKEWKIHLLIVTRY